jgi:hypothetical protein
VHSVETDRSPAEFTNERSSRMYARIARFEGVNVAAAEATMGEAEEVIRPMVEALDGYRGHLELIAADGDAISVTFFDSQQAAEAAEPTFDEEMPKKLGKYFTDWEGRRVAVGGYNVVIDERTG